MRSNKLGFGKPKKGSSESLSQKKKETDAKEQRSAGHKRAEELLRESEERVTKVFRSIPDALVISRLEDGKIVEVNDSWHKVFGYSREEVIGKRSLDLNLFTDSADRQRLIALIREQQSVRDYEFQIRQKSGTLRTAILSIELLEMRGEQYLLTVVQDITERKRAEEKIQSLAKFPDENPNPILRIARDGTLLYINEAGLNLLPEWHLQVGQAASPMLREAALQVMNRGSPQMMDFEHGQQAYSFSITPIVGAGYANLYARNVTERRQMEKALRKSESNLRALALQLSRTEERERHRLAIYLHDEIGQSLALVQLKLGSLAAASKSRSDKRQIKGLRDLLDMLIEQAHTLTFELSPPVFYQLGLEAAIEWAGEKISRDYGLEFSFNDDGEVKSLNSDLQAILFRCVRELMLNTAKHAKAKHLTVAIAREGEKIVFAVADDGLGFDTSLQDPRAEETGFGLLSIRENLASMGGHCQVRSNPGQGSRITLSVPLGERTP